MLENPQIKLEIKEHNLKTTNWQKKKEIMREIRKYLALDLNIRHDTINLLEENIGKTVSDTNHSNVFLGQSPKAEKINGT